MRVQGYLIYRLEFQDSRATRRNPVSEIKRTTKRMTIESPCETRTEQGRGPCRSSKFTAEPSLATRSEQLFSVCVLYILMGFIRTDFFILVFGTGSHVAKAGLNLPRMTLNSLILRSILCASSVSPFLPSSLSSFCS